MLEQTAACVSRRDVFYLGMAIAATAVVFGGFAPTYYLKSFAAVTQYPGSAPVSPSLPLLIRLHAMVSTTWLVLLLAQTTLVTAGRTDLHRRLGITGTVVAPLLAVLGVMTAIRGARDGWNPGGPFPDSLGFLVVTLGDILLFSSFVAAGFYYRRQRELHKRLMVLATISILPPATARLFFAVSVGIGPGLRPSGGPPRTVESVLMAAMVADMLILAAIVYDVRTRGRPHPVYVGGGAIVLAVQLLRGPLSTTQWWYALADSLARLAG